MDTDRIRTEINSLREQWRAIREHRLGRRDCLLAQGIPIAEVRHDREYRLLKKKQRALFVRLRQDERKLNRSGRGKKR